jgi:hypothetical protein
MSDIYVENYKKSVTKILDIWAKENEKLGKQLAPILDELANLQANKNPSPDEKKRIDELQKQREAIRKQAETAAMELKVNLMLIDVPPQADDKELVKIPAWLKDIVKKKGIPLGKSVTLVPDASIDVKAKKLKSFTIGLKWDW